MSHSVARESERVAAELRRTVPDEQLPTFGKGMAPGDRPYEWLQPADHTGV